MRQKTAARTRKHQQASSPQQSGLIAGKNNAPQSGTPRCALDNHSHRTACVSAAGDSPGGETGVRRQDGHRQAHNLKFLQNVRAPPAANAG